MLKELGLASALRALAVAFSTAGLTVYRQIGADLPVLGDNVELVLYRVGQEGLTNVAWHAETRKVALIPWRDGGES